MELKIMQKTYDLALYLYPALRQFPKSEKHTMNVSYTNQYVRGIGSAWRRRYLRIATLLCL